MDLRDDYVGNLMSPRISVVMDPAWQEWGSHGRVDDIVVGFAGLLRLDSARRIPHSHSSQSYLECKDSNLLTSRGSPSNLCGDGIGNASHHHHWLPWSGNIRHRQDKVLGYRSDNIL